MGYFDRINARNHTIMPGIGTIHTHGVGNSYTSSLDHHFLPEGAEKPTYGMVRFGVRIADDGSTFWVLEELRGPSTLKASCDTPKPTEETQTDYPVEVIAEMRRLSETLEERSPTGWFFDVYQRAEDDLKKLDRTRQDFVRAIEHLTELLSDPTEPKTHFVTKEECGLDKGFSRAASDSERAERRDSWSNQIIRTKAKLEKHDQEFAGRTAMLRAIRSALRQWSEKANNNSLLPSQVMAEAVANHYRRQAA